MSNVRYEKCEELSNFSGKNTTFWRKICCSCFPNLLHLRAYIFTAFQSWIRGFLFIKVPSFLCIFLATISCEKTTIANLLWNNKADKEYFLFIATSDILPVFIKIRIELMSSHFIPLVLSMQIHSFNLMHTFEIRKWKALKICWWQFVFAEKFFHFFHTFIFVM